MELAIRTDLLFQKPDASKKLMKLRNGEMSVTEFSAEFMGDDPNKYFKYAQEDDVPDDGSQTTPLSKPAEPAAPPVTAEPAVPR
jgi:hypothetical protein